MVPEPESWALLLAGLGLTGFAARRRARQRAGGASPAAQRPR
ncbi:PEPxxWA-CTERM sorting domain-containing protein [Salmonella enterica]